MEECVCGCTDAHRTMIQFQIQSLGERNHSSRDATTKHANPPARSRAALTTLRSVLRHDIRHRTWRLHTHGRRRRYAESSESDPPLPESVAYSEVLPDVGAAAADGRRLCTHGTSWGIEELEKFDPLVWQKFFRKICT